ncbi:sigma-70 family RNA polymerase sigma factor [Abyssalbus ytuae]|uniref:RNA polymerase sigma factor RpoD/SigA n=1 Tax=Abyssalbus ytuae TaxID=2926907 RepID=A0A9E6ZR02_9FLAO|nr:RNA polymerase sigma factor RpoD/SigA [Abyssalbus ytuae]UOB18890.1 RNA polymerase sigma factor RpoD/SigA [Abyssalbus ytuae]
MRQLKIVKQITNRENVSLDKYLQEIGKIDLVTEEEEVELAIRIRKGDQLALEKLISANLRFVVSVAKQYQSQGLTLPDLINEGNVGLVRAASRFDESRGFKFISYAVWWIRQSILQAIAEQSRIVRLPLNKISALNKISKASAFLEQTYQRLPSADEISEIVEISITEIKLCMKNAGRQMSLDAPLKKGEELNFYDLIKSNNVPEPDDDLMGDSLKDEINIVLNTLTQRESDIIKLFFGLDNNNQMTLEEIGASMTLTRERVRQIKATALLKLKKSGRSNVLIKYLG